MLKIYEKDYIGFESLYDIQRDVYEALDPKFNPNIESVPEEFNGTIKLTMEYIPNERGDEGPATACG